MKTFNSKKIIFIQYGVIFIFFVLIILLIVQNRSLIKSAPTYTLRKSEVASKIKQNYFLKKFPHNFQGTNFKFNDRKQGKDEFFNGHLIIAFDLTVCGQCLHSGLGVLKEYLSNLESKKINTLSVIGISNPGDESEIINNHRAGNFFFPCLLIPVEEFYSTFKLNTQQFLDTPFFVYTSHDFKILDVFKPKYLETKELHAWLAMITNQDPI